MSQSTQKPLTHSRAVARAFDLANMLLDANVTAERPYIYEAGGGSRTALAARLLDRAHTIVVDISQEQLDKCDYASETVLGSVEDWHKEGEVDLVSCINVLEHVENVESSLRNFAKSLKPGGVLFVASPRKNSLQGIVTRFTPHWFHVWYYRKIKGDLRAGTPGNAPFPVCFSHGIERGPMTEILSQEGLEFLCFFEYEGTHARILWERKRPLYYVYRVVTGIADFVTFGVFKFALSDFWVVAKKT